MSGRDEFVTAATLVSCAPEAPVRRAAIFASGQLHWGRQKVMASLPGGSPPTEYRLASAAAARAATAVTAAVRTDVHASPPFPIPPAHSQTLATASRHSWLRFFRSSS